MGLAMHQYLEVEVPTSLTKTLENTESLPMCNGSMENANPEICMGCGLVITDPYLCKVMAKERDGKPSFSAWHERCLKCSMCGRSLTEKCYSKHDRLYCSEDFQRLFSEKCPCCGEIIRQGDSVMRTPRGPTYHTQCFRCVSCGILMTTGEMFSMKECTGWLYCSQHTADLIAPTLPHSLSHGEINGADGYSMNSLGQWSDDGADPNRSRSEKRPRTVLSAAQRRVLKQAFEHDPKASKKARHMMALETGLSIRVVQVWFQNQRAKVKKKDYKEDDKKSPGPEKHGGVNMYGEGKDSNSRLSAADLDGIDDRPLSDRSGSFSDCDAFSDVKYKSTPSYFQFSTAADGQVEDHASRYQTATQNFPQFCF